MSGLVLQFPKNVEMDVTVQEYQRDSTRLQGQKILPFETTVAQRVEWDELDNETGRTGVHTMDTDPKVASRPGSKLKSYEPIPHKETELIKESELLKSRAFGTLGGVINIDSLVMEAFNRGMGKDDITMEVEIWQALQGRLVVEDEDTGVTIVDETFPVQEYNPLITWDNLAIAQPMANLEDIVQMFAGTGASGEGAVIHLNRATFNKVTQNSNTNDIKGYTVDNFRNATYSVEQLNKLLNDRKLPTFNVYDEGWYETKTDFRRFIAEGVAIVEGKRQNNQKVGGYLSTATFHRTKNGQPAPGRFCFIVVNGQPNTTGTAASLAQLGAHGNPSIGVIHGVYGGPRIKFPRSIVKLNAYTP